MIDLQPGPLFEHFEAQMLQRAVAGRRHVDAVGRRLGDVMAADRARRAGAILDHDLLA